MNNTIPVLCVPFLNRWDLLLRCVASIDHPVDNLMVIQNGPDDPASCAILLQNLQLVPVNKLHHVRTPNLGCGGSWNHAMLSLPAPWWMFSGNDIQFHSGSLAKMAWATWQNHESHVAMFGNHGHSWFVQTKLGTAKVGLYDPGFFPAYKEDQDWMYRRLLSGIPYINVEGATAEHGDGKLTGSCTIYSNVAMRVENDRMHENNDRYYRKKWGGPAGAEMLTSPFGQGGPINALVFDPEMRDENVWRL